MKFFAPGIPAPKGSARAITDRLTGKARLVASSSDANKAAQQAWAAAVGWAAKAACRGRVLTGPVRVAIVFVFARPVSHTRAQRSEPAHTVKPDVDKVLRSTLDALSGVAFVDDQQVCDVRGVKRYAAEGEQVGAWIEVQSLAVEAAEEMSA